MANLVRILPALALTRFDRSLPDREADGWQIVDLRTWHPDDPRDDQGKILRLANAVAAAIRGGLKVLLVDTEGRDRVALVGATALVAMGRSGPSAVDQVLSAHPEAFSGLSDRKRKTWITWLQSLSPRVFDNLPPAPKPHRWNETVGDGRTPVYINRLGQN